VAKLKRAADIQAKPVDWLWQDRIPRGAITTIAGKADQGKGLLMAHLAAEVSKAGGRVLYSAAEDSDEMVTRPRLEAAGARLDQVFMWNFQLPRHWHELAEIVVDSQIDLIVVDPFNAHLSNGISRFGDNERQVLTPMARLLETTQCALVIVEHALKGTKARSHPLDCIGGTSSGLVAASRAAFVFGRDPDDIEKRVMAPAKFNLGLWPKAMSFDLDVEDIDEVGDVPFLMADEELDAFDPMAMLAAVPQQTSGVGRPPAKRAAAAEWLTTYLADAGAPVLASTVQEDAKQWNLNRKTLLRAADDMGVVKAPPGGGRNCTWELPDEVKDLMGIPTDAPPADDVTTMVADMDDALSALLGDQGGDENE
jgi:hypothetical protein